MEKSTIAGASIERCIVRLIVIAVICGVFGLLTGCGLWPTKPTIKALTKSETEIAVGAIQLEWLQECEELAQATPPNQVGALLQDFADVAAALAECRERHNGLVKYLSPIVQKERGKTPATP